MKVITFDPKTGIYHFALGAFETEQHAHPALEVVYSPGGNFSISFENSEKIEARLAIIGPNVAHRLFNHQADLNILMLERKDRWVESIMQTWGISLEDGLYTTSKSKAGPFYEALKEMIFNQAYQENKYDTRIAECLTFIAECAVNYDTIMQELQAQVYLSRSRISHLFKAEMGLPLRKYLVWDRLRKTIESVLHHDESLYGAALRCGFHDQAHLSKAFKTMLGISPSAVYNSSLLQE